jgi:hypothetical protein
LTKEHSRNISVDQPTTYTGPCLSIVHHPGYNITKKKYPQPVVVILSPSTPCNEQSFVKGMRTFSNFAFVFHIKLSFFKKGQLFQILIKKKIPPKAEKYTVDSSNFQIQILVI